MSITQSIQANELLNRVAAEVGLTPVADPWADVAQHFEQMRYLLHTAGEELTLAHPWEWQHNTDRIITQALDTGNYPLPDDFLQMIDQTHWELSNNVPVAGPLSAQQWTWLNGRNLVDSTIYAKFRIKSGQISIFPQPPPAGLDINYEYQSSYWVSDGGNPATLTNVISNGSEIVLFDRTLISRFLKLKWLEAKGFDTTKPQDDFNQAFGALTGKDKGAPILNAGFRSRGMPYLDACYNLPDTGYGI